MILQINSGFGGLLRRSLNFVPGEAGTRGLYFLPSSRSAKNPRPAEGWGWGEAERTRGR